MRRSTFYEESSGLVRFVFDWGSPFAQAPDTLLRPLLVRTFDSNTSFRVK